MGSVDRFPIPFRPERVMLSISVGGQPLADFSQPLMMLADCHRRIEHFLDVLYRLVDRFGECPLSEEARGALEKSLAYFQQAAPRHTADEEESLFPRMRHNENAAIHAALAELERLEADHRRADSLHDRINAIGQHWLQSGLLSPTDRDELQTLLAELSSIYADHIRLEEERVFVLAAQMLSAEALREIGVEMQQRRSLPKAQPQH